MYFVYFLRSLFHQKTTYVGMTEDIHERLAVHNAGGSPATQRWRPWQLIAYVAVPSKSRAVELERYFKTGSGHAFWHKRFLG
ncbi:MAG: GIY-YIG nuclease family protein [Lentisphaerae bacterium]|nr:GIY-YIG nuclease family protein [Lentisphaerota bacterium]